MRRIRCKQADPERLRLLDAESAATPGWLRLLDAELVAAGQVSTAMHKMIVKQNKNAHEKSRKGHERTDSKCKTAVAACCKTAVAACCTREQSHATKRWRAGILDKRMMAGQGAGAPLNPAPRRRPVQAPWPVRKQFKISWNKDHVRSDSRRREWIKSQDDMVRRRANYMRLAKLKRHFDPDGLYNDEDSSVDMMDEMIRIDESIFL